jgi:hypothetical protein
VLSFYKKIRNEVCVSAAPQSIPRVECLTSGSANQTFPYSPQLTISVGYEKVARIMREILGQTGARINEQSNDGVAWCRDTQVVLLDGTHLIPHPLLHKEKRYDSIYKQMFPYSNGIPKGYGMDNEYVPGLGKIRKAVTCIEGGNIKFCRIGSENGAIVGVASVFLTMQAMEEQGLLSSDRIASCMGDIQQRMQANPEELEFWKSAVIQRSDFAQNVMAEAHELAAKYQIVTDKMAEELQISRKNLLIIEHMLLHIDLEMLVGPERWIFLHDPVQAIQVVKSHSSVFSQDSSLMLAELEWQQTYVKSGIFQRNQALLRHYFDVAPIPGYYGSYGADDAGQFFNGLLLRDLHNQRQYILLSNSMNYFESSKHGTPPIQINGCVGAHRLAEDFSRKMRDYNIQVIYVNCQGCLGGGIHCLTRVEKTEGMTLSPQSIPVNLALVSQRISTFIETSFIPKPGDFLVLCSEEGQRIRLSPSRSSNKDITQLFVPMIGMKFKFLLNDIYPIEADRVVLPGHHQRIDLSSLPKAPDGPPPEVTADMVRSSLMTSVRKNDVEIVRALLNKEIAKIDLMTIREAFGLAQQTGSSELIQVLRKYVDASRL